ncbi:MAG: HAMP domain-containing sensor histidine kinase [Microbacterium sp.]
MTLLAVGLSVAGFGTALFLRTTLAASTGASVQQLAPTDVASALFEIDPSAVPVEFDIKKDVPSPSYFVAIYGKDGALIESAGGNGAPEPVFPESITLPEAASRGTETFTIPNSEGGAPYIASTAAWQVAGSSDLFTQLVALPLAPTNQVVAQYIGIYSLLAVIILIGSAFLTRWLVTLTFGSLGQVESTAMAIAAGDFSQRMTDIEPMKTEVGRLKRAINAMLDRVDAALSQRDSTVRQMRRFIGDASHELRTPLVTVRGYAELYRMGAIAGDEDVAQAMDRIESEAKRMGFLVEDLLALARLDERRDVVIAPVDLRPIARDAALDVRATSPHRPVTVIDTTAIQERVTDAAAAAASGSAARKRSPAAAPAPRVGPLSLLRRKPRPVPASSATGVGEPPVTPLHLTEVPVLTAVDAVVPIVQGDENRIRQVVTNLLGNARRFTSENSPIELRIGVDPITAMGWIEVVDHGEGIPDQIKDKIFQRFWRADTSRARETGGTGLGLSIVASIIEALHGAVGVADTPGGGATFRVAFPLARSRDAAEHVDLETQPLERLIIDD